MTFLFCKKGDIITFRSFPKILRGQKSLEVAEAAELREFGPLLASRISWQRVDCRCHRKLHTV